MHPTSLKNMKKMLDKILSKDSGNKYTTGQLQNFKLRIGSKSFWEK